MRLIKRILEDVGIISVSFLAIGAVFAILHVSTRLFKSTITGNVVSQNVGSFEWIGIAIIGALAVLGIVRYVLHHYDVEVDFEA